MEAAGEGKVPANFELASEVKLPGPLWDVVTGACTELFTNEFHLAANQTGTCALSIREVWKPEVFIQSQSISILGDQVEDSVSVFRGISTTAGRGDVST